MTTLASGNSSRTSTAHGLLRNQAVAAGGHHHRVQHHLRQLVAADGIGHHAHHVGRVQHADLDGIDANVLDHGVDLGAQHVGRHAVDGRARPAVFCAVMAVMAVMP